MTGRVFRGIAGALTLLGVIGCEGGTEPVPSDAVGVYELIRVGASELPTALGPVTAQQLTAIRGDLILREDGEYRQIIQTRYVTNDGNSSTGTNTTAGEFMIEGPRIELSEDFGPTRAGTITAGEIGYEITVAGAPVALRWKK